MTINLQVVLNHPKDYEESGLEKVFIEISGTDTMKADSIKLFAEKILEGTILPSDDIETINCLDSTVSDDSSTRRYYLKVFRVIASKSDGALSDIVSVYSNVILNKFPLEFIDFYVTLTESEKANFIEFIAYDINTGSTNLSYVNAYFEIIQDKCFDCDGDQTRVLERIKEGVIKSLIGQHD